MKLRVKNNPLLHMYNFALDREHGRTVNNLCALTWGTLLGVILIPLMPISFILSFFSKTRLRGNITTIAKILINFLYFWLPILLYKFESIEDFWIAIGALFGTPIAVLVGAFITITVVEHGGSIKPIRYIGENVTSPLKEGIKGIKNKYCPIIEWKDDE